MRSRKGQQVKGRNLDIFGVAPTENLELHWVPSHLTAKQFGEQVGQGQDWRRVINAEVDQLVGARAKKLVPERGEEALGKADTLVASVAGFLGRRMQALWSYDKDQGPQVVFPKATKAATSTEATGSSSNRSSFQKKKRKAKAARTPPRTGGLVAGSSLEAPGAR